MTEENTPEGTPEKTTGPETTAADADTAHAATQEPVTPAEFGELNNGNDGINGGGAAAGISADLELVRDIPVTVSVEVGRNAISISNLLQLSQGSVVELDREAGEPLDVLVNGCLIAHGEVVVVNDKFGIRLTEVVSPSERVRKLN